MGRERAAGRRVSATDRLAEWAPPAGILLFHLAFLPGYGVFRDELYYMACGRRPGWGYVDHPPLVGWVAWLVAQVAGESHLALRVVAALAMAATVWLAGRIALSLGGGPFAVALAAVATGLAPVALSLGSYYSMNVFDLLFWALIAWILVRVLSGGDERLWLAFGAVAGLGLLNKISILFLGFGLVVGLVFARRWDVFRSRRFWAGGLLALAIFLPHLLWQQANGWPTLEFMANARRDKKVPLSAPGFVREALLQTAPMAWLWVAGLAWLLLARASARVRALGFAFLAVVGSSPSAAASRTTWPPPTRSLRRRRGGAGALDDGAGARRSGRSWPCSWSASGSRSRRSRGRSCRWRRTCATPPRSVRSPAPTSARPSAACRSSSPTCRGGARWRRRWRASSTRCRPRTARRPASSARTTARPGRSSTSAASSVCRPRSRAQQLLALGARADCTGEVMLVIGDRRERLDERFAEVRLGGVPSTARTACPTRTAARSGWPAA